MKIENTLNGGYLGLVGEVETEDCYRLRRVGFTPSVIYDVGGNVGVFARFARKLFPDALIVSVEPHKANCKIFKKYTNDKNTILIEKAIGIGQVWRDKNATNGAGENYISDSVGYPKDEMVNDERMELMETETIMIDELVNTYLKEGMKSILKLDIEAGENVIWNHKPSMDALKRIDYICCELHRFGLHGGTWQAVQDKTKEALASLEETHICESEGVHFWATEKSIYKQYVPPVIVSELEKMVIENEPKVYIKGFEELWMDFNNGKINCKEKMLSDTVELLYLGHTAHRIYKCGNIIFENSHTDLNVFTWRYNTGHSCLIY